MASSSREVDSSRRSAGRWKYDVFLSFRGPDTRQGITVDIRDRLQRRGIRTFMDDLVLRKGDPISPTLMEAIEKSRYAVLVLSRGYADSPWCLDELVKICECMGDDPSEKRIFPIFYHLEPTEVRYSNKGSFKEAFAKHEASGRHQPETVDKWRAALKQVADYSGWTTDHFDTHRELIDDVVETLGAPNTIEFKDDFQAYEETIKAMDKVNEALRDEKVTVVGVHGMGGVGKTTMVTHVAEQVCRDGIFDRWIMVTISQNQNVKRIQGILSEFLGVKLDEKSKVEVRAAKLHAEFMRRENLLIILDDVWDEIDLSEIGIPNSKGLEYCSSKMLLTTRIGYVCRKMECHKITLNILSDEDSWTLFKRKTITSFESPTFEDVARTVAKECGGLPIALVTVARALGDKGLHEWKRAAERLGNSQHANPDDDGKASKCIRLSYDYLKDVYKPFFLLCCLFPKDHKIEIEDLFMYAMGIQLFQDVDTLEQARMDAKIWVGHLQDSCLLLGRGGEEIKMHDVVRDTAIQISGFFVQASRVLEDWPDRISKGCTAISLMDNDIGKLPENLVCPKLQILLLNQNFYLEEIPETFFQCPNDLRVLDLAETWRLSLLPQSISLLTNLTFLSLLGCEYLTSDTSILGKLKNLKILYLSIAASNELSVELGGLTNLRIFSCDDEYLMRIPPGVISEWKNLEELHLKGFPWWGHEGWEEEETTNAGFKEVTGLSKLRVLKATVFSLQALPTHVDLVPEWVEFHITIGFRFTKWSGMSVPRCSRSIQLELDNISDLPDWFRDGLMKRADYLYWKGCKNLSDIFVDLEHERLLKLKCLYLEYSSQDETEESFTEYEIEQSSMDEIGESFSHDESHRNPLRIPVLQNLEKLTLDGLHCEKSLEAVQTLPHGSLLNLKELNIEACYADGDALISLAKLQILSNLETIRIDSIINRYIFRHDELFVSLQLNIRKIMLKRCSMIGICEGRAPPTIFQKLQNLDIDGCVQLEGSLFTHEVAQCLPQLDSLILCNCSLLERIVEAGKKKKTVLPKLKQLRLRELPVLCYDSASLDIVCPLLEEMDVKECPNFLVSIVDFHRENQVQLHGDPFTGRTQKQVVGDIVDSISTHTVGSEEFQETGQGMDEVMELHTSDEFSTIGICGTEDAGKRIMVEPFGSASSSAVNWKYDVYLSFTGEDMYSFTSNLCDGLKKRGITTFMDADIQVGDPISLTPINAITESRFVFVILSPQYSASTWCLEKLTEICKFMEENLIILPVFYSVNCSDVRDQKGRFEDAFTKHERSGKHGSKKVQQWREALRKVGSLSGWHSQDYRTEGELTEAIVEFLCSKIYTADFKIFKATKQAMDELLNALCDEEVAAIGVYGAGGVGKTTMVEHICATVVYEGVFHQVITAVVSKNPDLRELQGTLAGMLGIELDEETDIERSYRLMQEIRRGNRILIVLEDIWENINLSSIGIPGYHELKRSNSKVLFITRSQEVLSAMKCGSNICLGVLSKEDSWTLFLNSARVSYESVISYDAAKKLSSLCAGLPIALIAVAKALGSKDKWEEAAQRLANPEDEDIMFTCIKLSYDYLPYDDARSCFLLCCLFPEDYNIQIEDLLKYGMGKGLFKDSKTMQDARASAHSVVKYLKDCSLLMESGLDGYVKMHDVIRDVAIRISSSEDGKLVYVQAGCQLKKWPGISAPEDYCAISLIMNKICKLPEDFECSKLLVLFMQSNVCLDKIPEKFFQGMNKLRVLDMSRTRISLLPMSFILLINLHTLYLDGCLAAIENISLLGELEGLKILSMRDLPLVELPKEIGDLKNLRMLDVTGEYVDIVPAKVIGTLDKLEELYMQCNFTDWGSNKAYGSEVEKSGEQNMASFDELTSLSNLNILKVFISDAKSLPEYVVREPNWVNFDICISNNSSIRKVSFVSNASPLCTRALTVDTTIITLPGWFINVVTSKTEKLQYMTCQALNNILVEYDRWSLHALKYLSVIGKSEKLIVLMDTETLVTNEPVFQNLEELHVVQVDCLQKLCVGELPQGSLRNLRILEVKHCYELEDALLPSQLLQRLQNLEKLICEEIDELEYVFGCEGLQSEDIVLTQLKDMRLEKLENLTKIWNGPAPCTIFQNLLSLVVSECFELKTLFTADVARNLLQLEDLTVESCMSIETIIEVSKDTMDIKIVIPRLKHLALISLPELTRFYGTAGSSIECPQLKTLCEKGCPLFSTSDFRRVKLINHQQHLNTVNKSFIVDMEDCKDGRPEVKVGEDLIVASKSIARALGSKKNLTNGERKILADLGTKLSSLMTNRSTLNEIKVEDFGDIEERVTLIQDKIMGWEADQTMIWASSSNEMNEYLSTVEEARQVIESLESLCLSKDDEKYELLHRANDVVQTAMSRLEDEFRYMLVRNRHPCAPEHMSFRSSEEDSVDVNSWMSFGNDSVDDSFQRDSFSRASVDSIVDLVRPEVVPDLRCIANMMFSCNYEKECTQAYTTLRRDALDECLLYLEIQKLCIEDVRKMEWVSLNSNIRRWVWVMKIFVRVYLASEKLLSEQIFEELGPVRLDCFVEASKASILQLLNFAEAMSIGPHQPEKLVRILDMYEVLANVLPDIDDLYFGEAGSSISMVCHDVLLRLGESVKAMVAEFENVIASNPSTNAVWGGGIHPLTRYVMNYMSTLADYSQTLNLLLKNGDEGDSVPLSPDTSPTKEEENISADDSSGRKSPMARQFLSFASSLESNLDEKSKLYKDASLQHVFLMNNIYYMAQKVKGAELRLIFEDDWIRKHNRMFQQHAMGYQRASWSYILSLLKEEGIQNPGSNSISKSLLKERLRVFYLTFEEIYKVQSAWLIPDPQLREDLQISTSLNVIQAYRTFVGRHANDISDKLIKYSADDMENYLLDLFEGSPKLLQSSSRR